MTREEIIINEGMTIHALHRELDALHQIFDDLNSRDTLLADFESIDEAQDKLASLVEKIKSAQQRRNAKATNEMFRHLFAEAAE